MRENTINTRKLGCKKEVLAMEYLRDHGITILCKNYQIKGGEIDLIGMDRDYIIFFEVKYRAYAGYGYPLESISYQKQEKIRRTALHYLYANGYEENISVRFDCVGILGEGIEWIQNAF